MSKLKTAIQFIKIKQLQNEFNEYLTSINNGEQQAEDATALFMKQPEMKYNDFIPLVLKESSEPMTAREVMEAYRERATKAAVRDASKVKLAGINAYLVTDRARKAGCVKEEEGSKWTYEAPTGEEEDNTPTAGEALTTVGAGAPVKKKSK